MTKEEFDGLLRELPFCPEPACEKGRFVRVRENPNAFCHCPGPGVFYVKCTACGIYARLAMHCLEHGIRPLDDVHTDEELDAFIATDVPETDLSSVMPAGFYVISLSEEPEPEPDNILPFNSTIQ